MLIGIALIFRKGLRTALK